MLNNKNKITNERILYQTRQNPIIGCKKVIFGFILLIIVCSIIPSIISFIGNIQTYLISYLNLTLTRYAAIFLFVVIIFIILYIIRNLLSWYFTVYTLTNYRIITKKGVIEKLINVGTISIYSAYDNNDIELKNISNPKNIEELLFNQMYPTSQKNNNLYHENHPVQFQNNYKKSKNHHNKHKEDNNYRDYNYEYHNKKYNQQIQDKYSNDLEDDINNIKNMKNNFKLESFNPEYTKYNNKNYNEKPEIYYNDPDDSMENYFNNNKQDIQFQQEKNKTKNKQKTPLERHFDKFKK